MPIQKRVPSLKVRQPPRPRAAEPDLPWATDERDTLELFRLLAHPNNQGLQIHVWPTKEGFQANVQVKVDGNGWAVAIKRSPVDALHNALASKCKVLKL